MWLGLTASSHTHSALAVVTSMSQLVSLLLLPYDLHSVTAIHQNKCNQHI